MLHSRSDDGVMEWKWEFFQAAYLETKHGVVPIAVNNPSADNDNCTIKAEWSDMGLYLFVRSVKHVDGGRVLLIVISLYGNKTVIWPLQ